MIIPQNHSLVDLFEKFWSNFTLVLKIILCLIITWECRKMRRSVLEVRKRNLGNANIKMSNFFFNSMNVHVFIQMIKFL